MLESFFNNFAGLQAHNFITKRLQHRCFPVNIVKFLKTSILKDIFERLLLNLLIQSWRNNRKNRDVFRDDNRRRIQDTVKHLRWSFCRNSWLDLTADYFGKTIHITCFTWLWICLDKTKQNRGVLSFISQKIRTAISANLFSNSILSSHFYLALRH